MDWFKVKRILIIALVLTNIVIIYFLFQKNANNVSYSEEQRLHIIEDILLQREIINQIEHPPKTSTMPKVSLEYQDYDLATIAKKIFSEGFVEEGGGYSDKEYMINLVDNGSIFYLKSKKVGHNPPPIPIETAKLIAEKFIKKLGFSNDYYYIGYEQKNKMIKLNYIQSYEDYFIDNTYMYVTIGEGVDAIERCWTKVTQIEGESLNIISYGEALFKAFDLIEKENYPRPLKIEKIKLGYGLNTSAFGEVILSGEALPYYRFFLSEGEAIVVPALRVQ